MEGACTCRANLITDTTSAKHEEKQEMYSFLQNILLLRNIEYFENFGLKRFFFWGGVAVQLVGPSFPNQGLNPGPWQ